MGSQKYCDVCKMYRQKSTGESDVLRYTLRREMDQTRTNGERAHRSQQSAGGIDLCSECWGRICQPRMNANKARHPGVWGPGK